MSTEQSLYPPTKSCGCVKFVGGRKKRRTRRKRRKHHKKRKTHHRHKSHKRHRTRHRHKRRRTRHRRRKGGVGVLDSAQIRGGYKEGLLTHGNLSGGGKKHAWAVSDYPPGFSKYLTKDKELWKKIKHKKKHRKH